MQKIPFPRSIGWILGMGSHNIFILGYLMQMALQCRFHIHSFKTDVHQNNVRTNMCPGATKPKIATKKKRQKKNKAISFTYSYRPWLMPNRMSFSFPTPHTENMKKKNTRKTTKTKKRNYRKNRFSVQHGFTIFKRILGANNKQKAKQQNNTKWIILKS